MGPDFNSKNDVSSTYWNISNGPDKGSMRRLLTKTRWWYSLKHVTTMRGFTRLYIVDKKGKRKSPESLSMLAKNLLGYALQCWSYK